jgi:hypothetical protein
MRSIWMGGRSRWVIPIALALATVVVALTSPADSRGAESFGQIGEAWGSFGTTAGKFREGEVGMVGVDPVDGSVYVGDVAGNNKNYRVQKFSAEGTLLAATEISRFAEPAKEIGVTTVHGVAIDHATGRFYVLLGCRVLAGSTACQKNIAGVRFGATKVLVFKIQPQGAQLVLETELELPAGAEQLYEPRAIAVDPANHELEVLAETSAGQGLLQRVKPSGELGPRFVDSAGKLTPSVQGLGPRPATSIAIGPDGTTYLVTGGEHSAGANWTRAWQLPQNLSQLTEVPHFAETAESEGWTQGFLGRETPPAPFVAGAQIAISPDGETLYWKEEGPGAETMVIRGYSLTENSTRVVYGGGTERCKLKGEAAGLGTVGDRLVAIDYETAKVITFGPGGTGCPTPSAQFTVNGKEEEGVAVEAETPVTFDASGSKQEGAEPRALVWDFGDGKTETVECEWTGTQCGEEAEVTATHKYLSSGTFTVSLQYKLEHPVFGNPPTVTHTVEVTGGGSGTLFKLTVTKAGTGAGTVIDERGIDCGVDCENEYREGKSVSLSAFPQAGSTFVGWGGACVGSGTCTVPITEPKAVTATFEAAPAPPPTGGGGGAASPAAPAPVPAPTTGVSVKHKKKQNPELKQEQRCKKLKNKRKRARCAKKANSRGGKHPKASGSGS